MRAWIAMIAVCAMAAVARADAPSDEVAVAAATRFETGPRLCKAMNRANRTAGDCRAILRPHVRWMSRVRGNTRVVETEIGPESIWTVTLVVDARGRVISESSSFAYGGP